MRLYPLIATTLLVVTPLFAQREDVAKPPDFEVTSIKRATVPLEALPRLLSLAASCGLPGVDRSGSRIAIPAGTVCGLIRVAYNVADYQVVGIPAELAKGEASNLLEIEARIERGTEPTMDDIRLMLQTLLKERFQLRIHREPREMPVYALTVAKGGPKWTPCSNPDAPSVYSQGKIISCTPAMTMTRVAQMLTREAGRPVIDKTGLTGTYSFEVHWLPDGAPSQPDSPPSLFTALQEQLGLRLEPQRNPVDSIIVDYVERPSPN